MTDESKRLLKLLRTYHNGTYAKAIDEALELASYSQIKWIPTSERLPEKEGAYLVTCGVDYPFLAVLEYDPEKGWHVEGDSSFVFSDCYVRAWVPMPEPYKEGEHEE